ncbi:AraC family transcriptional regulator [Oxalobacteraceae bacterium A2-2]
MSGLPRPPHDRPPPAPERSQDARDYQHIRRTVAAMPREYEHGAEIARHSHERAQLIYAAEGVIRVRTEFGMWLLPPRRALLIPPEVEHEVATLGKVSMRSLYIEAGAAAPVWGPRGKVIEVSPLLRELILALMEEPIEYPVEGRGGHLAALIMSELAAAETVPLVIPWPRDRRLVAVCSAILDDPGSPRGIQDWADTVGASARTLMRLFTRETGLHYRQWLQQVHLADAFLRLERGDSVGSIAAALGYASPSAFTAMFRRILGRTPQHYLNEWRPTSHPGVRSAIRT